MWTFRVDPHLDLPASRQIVEAVLDGVASGRLAVGERLPSVRAMAGEALVNPNTVGKAYRELEMEGVTESRQGDGVFVTETGPERARALRRRATLESFRQAVLEGLRAGHDPDALSEVFESVLRTARSAGGAKRARGA
jgi:GntR family transcriptional regulator